MKNTTINFDAKSGLAKLLATENLQVQHDNVQTASFNLEDRVLTIPVFKNPKGAVYDMLIAHEVAHALHTPQKGWKKSVEENGDIRDYINVLEDCRIDKIIKKQYPGVVADYQDGFKILWADNFFGCSDKNLNTDLMLIDKINLFYKSSETLSFDLSDIDKTWFAEVEKIKTFKDVVELAKRLAEWQKKMNENLSKLPDFDNHPLVKAYGQKEKEQETDGNSQSPSQSQSSDQSNEETESGKDKQDGNKSSKEEGDNSSKSEDGENKNNNGDGEDKEDKSSSVKDQHANPDGAGGKDVKINMPLKSITNESAEKSTQKDYVDTQHRGYSYMTLPDSNLDDIIITNKQWLNENIKKCKDYTHCYSDNMERFKTFHKDSKKTIQYLVKEFEMKKSADGYKRMTTDKTGILDPLKLKDYKFSEDIFKRMSIIPDAKNHGMILLLDWSGSMAPVIGKTVEQLCQLVWFVKQINIPFKVYFFADKVELGSNDYNWKDRAEKRKARKSFKYNSGDAHFDDFNLVEVASHTIKKTDLEQSLMFLWSYAKHYEGDRHWRRDGYVEYLYPPYAFHLSSTPLNESLAAMNKIIPLFKQKYQVEKMSLITLTDGHSNNDNKTTYKTDIDGTLQPKREGYGKTALLKVGSKYIKTKGNTTALLLQGIKRKYNVTTIGFFIVKTRRSWEFERYLGLDHIKDYFLRDQKADMLKKEFSKNKSVAVSQNGYNEFYLINGKDMSVDNANLNDLKEDAKKGDIKRVFTKSMKSRTVSRVLLSKFIKQVA